MITLSIFGMILNIAGTVTEYQKRLVQVNVNLLQSVRACAFCVRDQ